MQWLYPELHEAMVADKRLQTKGQMTEVMVRRESGGQREHTLGHTQLMELGEKEQHALILALAAT